MFKRDVGRFVTIGIVIQSFYNNLFVIAAPKAVISTEERDRFIAEMEGIIPDCRGMKLPKTEALVSCVVADFRRVEHSAEQLKSIVRCISEQFNQELRERLFVQIDPDRQPLLLTAEEFSQSPLFGEAVAANFSSTNVEAREAGLCYATYRHTACVFHCMRVLEKGLFALAHELQVPFKIPFEYENWKNILEPIEKQIRQFEATQPKGVFKTETLKTYSEAATQFYYFKDAWRNHVAHGRESYDPEQAKLIFDHVGQFMKHLAEAGLRDQ